MNNYILKIELLSDTIIGSGESLNVLIDTDIVLDELGIPYLPSKRLKGLLSESAEEIAEVFKVFGETKFEGFKQIIFGTPGNDVSGILFISNLYIEDYTSNFKYLSSLLNSPQKSSIVTRSSITNYFTSLRNQTTIDEISGTAKNNSLRTSRVLNKGLVMFGEVELKVTNLNEEQIETVESFLVYSTANVKNMGTKRNRGFGHVDCCLIKNGEVLKIEEQKNVLTNETN